MSAWILRRRTVTLKHLKFLQEDGQGSSSTSAKPVACCMHFGNGLIVVTRTSLRMKDEIVLLMLLMPLMHVDIQLQVSHLAVCTDASELGGGLCYCTGLTKCGGVQACALACGHECAMAVNHGGDCFSMDLGVPTV